MKLGSSCDLDDLDSFHHELEDIAPVEAYTCNSKSSFCIAEVFSLADGRRLLANYVHAAAKDEQKDLSHPSAIGFRLCLCCRIGLASSRVHLLQYRNS